MGFDIKIQTTKELKPHARMPHVIVIVIIVLSAMLTTKCYSIMSHAMMRGRVMWVDCKSQLQQWKSLHSKQINLLKFN